MSDTLSWIDGLTDEEIRKLSEETFPKELTTYEKEKILQDMLRDKNFITYGQDYWFHAKEPEVIIWKHVADSWDVMICYEKDRWWELDHSIDELIAGLSMFYPEEPEIKVKDPLEELQKQLDLLDKKGTK